MFFVYLIENSIDKSWYTGFTTDIDRRLTEHNSKIGGDYTGRKQGCWKLIYSESYLDKRDALGREKFLKSGSGRRFLKKQLASYLSVK
ncbi:MAG: GIY-YIG nuclease family protein [Candidatus Berkelbacteria bacterium]